MKVLGALVALAILGACGGGGGSSHAQVKRFCDVVDRSEGAASQDRNAMFQQAWQTERASAPTSDVRDAFDVVLADTQASLSGNSDITHRPSFEANDAAARDLIKTYVSDNCHFSIDM